MTSREESHGHNVLAFAGKGAKKIYLSAHIDTKPNTPGALDNGSGVATLLALAQSIDVENLECQVCIVLFNGEDYFSTIGEVVFMDSMDREFDLAINVDGVGLANHPTSLSFYEFNERSQSKYVEALKEFPHLTYIEPWPMGDHMIFAMSGIPSIAITSGGIFDLMETVIHTPDDVLKNIDIDILLQLVEVLGRML